MKDKNIKEETQKQIFNNLNAMSDDLKEEIYFIKNHGKSFQSKIATITEKRKEFIQKNTKEVKFTIKLLIDGYHFYKTSLRDTKEIIETGRRLEILDSFLNKELKKENLEIGKKDEKTNLNEFYKFNNNSHTKFSKTYLTSILPIKIKRELENDILKELPEDDAKKFLMVDRVEELINSTNIPMQFAPADMYYNFNNIRTLLLISGAVYMGKTYYVQSNYEDKETNALLGNLLDLYNKYTKKIIKKEFKKPILKPTDESFGYESEDEYSFDPKQDDLFYRYLKENKFSGLLDILNSLPSDYGLEFLRNSKKKFVRVAINYDISFFWAKNDVKKHQDAIKYKEWELDKKNIKNNEYTKFLNKNKELLKTNKCLTNSYRVNQYPLNLKTMNNYFAKIIEDINQYKNFTAREVLGNQKVYLKNTYDFKHLYFDTNEKQVDALFHSNVTYLKNINENQYVCLIINDEDIVPALQDAKKEMGTVLKLFVTSNDLKQKISREIREKVGDKLIYPKEEIVDWIQPLLNIIIPNPYPKISWGILNSKYAISLKERVEEKRKEMRKENKKKNVINLNEEIDLSKIDDSIDRIFADLDKILKNLSFKIE